MKAAANVNNSRLRLMCITTCLKQFVDVLLECQLPTHCKLFSIHVRRSRSQLGTEDADKMMLFIRRGEGLEYTCYSAAYMSRLVNSSAFTILEVAADWNELVVRRRITWQSITCDGGQLDPRCSTTDIPLPQSAALGIHLSIARKLLVNRLRRI